MKSKKRAVTGAFFFGAWAARLEQLARIHDAGRIQQLFDALHHAQLEWVLEAQEIIALELADAMLGADAAAVARHLIQHFGGQRLAMLRSPVALRARGRDRL